MTEQQKRGLAFVSVIIVCAVALYLVWLTAVVMGTDNRLAVRQPGRLFMFAVHNWNGLSIFLKSLPVLVTLGITAFARYKLRDWQFYRMLGLSALGILASIYLYLEITTVETARRFWAYSPVEALDSYTSFVSAAQIGLAAIGAWLLALQLGVKMP